jgi:hypothetical protein
MVRAMPKSLSNREALVSELRNLVTRYQSKPSTLLAELEEFLDTKGRKPWKPTREPTWKVMGFNSKKEMQDFENRTDFPGWDAL